MSVLVEKIEAALAAMPARPGTSTTQAAAAADAVRKHLLSQNSVEAGAKALSRLDLDELEISDVVRAWECLSAALDAVTTREDA